MAYRGRLIFPKLIEIARLNTEAIEQAGDYDHTFGEIRSSNRNRPGQTRTVQRQETLVRVHAQIETDTFKRISMGGLGQVPESRMVCVCFGPELEDAGLLDAATKQCLLKPTDRLAAIYEIDETLILSIVDPPGLYATQVQPSGFGFGAGGYNLVELSFEGRPHGTTGGGGVG
jgi:hypothetical protein